jgi:hypothetical protein
VDPEVVVVTSTQAAEAAGRTTAKSISRGVAA